MLNREVLARVLALSTGEKLEYDRSRTWVDLFLEQARQSPEKVAVVAENGSLTYGELDALSGRAAAALIEKGVAPSDFVAVRMGRVKEFPAAALAIHRAGAAYMPIDLEYPENRVTYMLEDSGARLQLNEENFACLTSGAPLEKPRCTPDSRAYMIYTSGSTGKPKGVVIPHRGLTNLVHFISGRWGLTGDSRVACHANFAFDAAVEDLFPVLTVGGTLYIVPEAARRDIFAMRDYIEKHHIRCGCYATQFGQLLALDKPLDVDYICLGGEAMTSVPKVTGAVYNTYGPTEFTVDATYYELEKGREYPVIPIGRPLYNCAAYIVDEKLNLLPPGETGELCLSGPQLAEGYWNRPELTAEKFTALTLSEGETVKIYRTGDLARWNDEGELEFCGRIDTQVKLRGFRVELGEVESRAARYPGIRQAAAEVKRDTLCLYYTAAGDVDEGALSAFLAESLADYMVPGAYIRLDAMPENVNGKIDRKTLPEPALAAAGEYVAPETDAERDAADTMARVLGMARVGATDDFYALGGDSIKAIRLVSLLREAGYAAGVSDVMAMRTPRALARSLSVAGEMDISQAPIEGFVEDTAIFADFKDLNYPDPDYYNQSTLLKWRGRASLDALQRASDAITAQHDMLRAVLRDGHLFVRPAEATIKIEEYAIADDADAIKSLCEDIQAHLSVRQALVRQALIHAGERDLFFITAHHTIVDGVSWRIWLGDLETAYGQALRGEDVRLPAKTHTYRDYAETMKAYRSSYALSLEIPCWTRVHARMLALGTSANKDYERRFGNLGVAMSEADTDAFLRARLEVLRLEVDDLLLTAVGESSRRVFYGDALSVSMEGYGREPMGRVLNVDRTIGWFTSVYPVVVEGFTGEPIGDMIRVKEALRAVPGKGVGYNILTYLDGAPAVDFTKDRAPMLIFNYLGDVSGEYRDGQYFEPDDGYPAGLDYLSPKNCDGPDLNINCGIYQGRFLLWLGYNAGRYTAAQARDFAEGILERIAALTAHLNAQAVSLPATASDLGETEWSAAEFEAARSEFAARGEAIRRIYPLTPMQESMLLQHITHPESSAYRLVDIYRCDASVDEAALRRAVDALAAGHEALRTAIIYKTVSAYRQVVTDRRLPLDVVEAADFAAVRDIRLGLLRDGFDLQDKPLARFVFVKTPEGNYLIAAIHHIVIDGWCYDAIIDDLNRLLRGATLEGSDEGQYERAVRQLIALDRRAASEYFAGLLEGLENGGSVPSWGEVPEGERAADSDLSFALPPEAADRLAGLCRSAGATLADGFNLLWALALATVARLEDVAVNTIVSGRDGLEMDVSDLVGLFINSVPVRVKLDKSVTARELLNRLHRQAVETKRFDFCPLADIQRAVGAEVKLGGLTVSLENYAGEGLKDAPLTPALIKEEYVPGFVGVAAATRSDGGIDIRLSFDVTLYRAAEIERLYRLVENLLARVIESPDTPVALLPRLSDADEADMLALSRGEALQYDAGQTWVDMFVGHAKRNPDGTAVVDSEGRYTYGELDRASDSVAAYLLAQGVAENSFVAVKTGRVKEFVAAVLGVNKAGAAYVPVDPDYPPDRIEYMLSDSEAKVVLTEAVIRRAAAEYPDAGPVNRATPKHLAYMIYTSGSTGRPKGVMQSHRSLRAFVAWGIDLFNITPESVHGHHPSFSFDASLVDLMHPLSAGAAVHIFPESLRRDMAGMAEYIDKNHLTNMTLSTQLGMAMVNQYPDMGLRNLLMGGEKLMPCAKTRMKLINGYGPTEFTVCSSFHVVDQPKDVDIPIGRPVPNTYSLICDARGKLLPRGMAGELCLAGPQIAEGYWRRPELTAERFTDCAYLPGQKMYRTGDLARYSEDGELMFLGRIDNQVKLRGFRIELGEIENRASQYAGVNHVAAEVRKDQLVLYYTASRPVDIEALRAFMAEALTEYMVPSAFMPLETMPMTPVGKINRKALPEPALTGAAEYVAPVTAAEVATAEAIKQLLNVDAEVGALDSFFGLGGDSIKAIRLVSMLREKGYQVTVTDIMGQKTVRGIAASAAGAGAPTASQTPFEGAVTDTAIVAFFKDLHLPDPAWFNQAQLTSLPRGTDADALQTAWNQLTRQHDMLRAVVRDGGLFVRSPETIIPVETYRAETDAEITNICQNIQCGIDMAGALVRCALIHGAAADYCFIAAHHLVVDGVSWRIIADDLDSALHNAPLPARTSSYGDYAEALRRYRDHSRLEAEIPGWEAVQRKLEALPASKGKDYGRDFGSIRLTMDAVDTSGFLRAPFDRLNMDINDALLTAVGRSYRDITGENDLSVQLEGHGREDIGGRLALDRTVGWFTSVYPVILEGLTGDLRGDLLNVKEALHRVPNKGVGYNILRFIDGAQAVSLSADIVPRVGFNYMGEMDFDASEIDHGAEFSPRNIFGPDIAINCEVSGGRFRLDLDYSRAALDDGQAERFAAGVLAHMRAIAAYLEDCAPAVTASDQGETVWSAETFDAVMADFAARGETVQRIFPLLPMQEGMLFKYVSEPDSTAYRLVDIYEMEGVPTEARLRRALERLAERHEVLRTAVIHENVAPPRQAIVERRLGLRMVDLTGEADPLAAALRLRADILKNDFDLQRKPLFGLTCAKKDENHSYIIVAVHHIIVDGWCIHLYMTDLQRCLSEAMRGVETPEATPAPGRYEAAVRQRLQEDLNPSLKYWRELLADYETRAEIPSYGEVPEAERCDGDHLSAALDPALTARYENLCREAGATLGNGVELAWGLVLGAYSRTEDAVFAKVVSGRGVDVGDVMGLFINSVPVRVKTGGGVTARQALNALQSQTAATNAHDMCPLSLIQRQTSLGSELFQTVLAFENYETGETAGEELLKPIYEKEEIFDEVSPSAAVEDGRLTLDIALDNARRRESDIRGILALFRTFIEGMVENPDVPLADLERLDADALAGTLRLSKGDKLDYDAGQTWVELFKSWARRDPDRTAVADGTGRYTYGELDRASDSVAAYLLDHGVTENSFVAVRMGRVKEFVAAVLGVNKAGAAYVPVDPDYPEDRIEYMLSDSEAKAVLTEDAVARAAADYPDAEPVNRATRRHLAYMIYTSGSTGRPKGVMQSHRSLRAFVAWGIDRFNITPESVHGHHPSFSFDASLDDLMRPLSAGAAVHIFPESLRRDMAGLAEYIRQNHLTNMTLSTQLGMAMVNQYPDMGLRYLLMGGEKLMPCAKTRVKLINGYGPTEFTVCSSFYVVDQSKDADIPIGRPVPNTYSLICDARGKLLPRGMAGELCLAGPQIAEGYWRRPELTAERFTDCAYLPGQKMYRTGDLARYSEDGELMFLGRIDNQVKLRGFRIELGEIENRASQYAGVNHVAAEVRKDQLVLYYTADADIDREALRAFLAEALTDYMVPTVYTQLPAMPMTPNGKINRKALPEPDAAARHAPYAAPETEAEKKLCAAFAGALGLDPDTVGIHDDFFELGGDSLKSMRAVSLAGLKGLSVAQIYRLKTPAAIAEAFDEAADEISETEARKLTLPITPAQLSMMDFQFVHAKSVMYNMPLFYQLDDDMDPARFEAAVNAAVRNHPALYTVFEGDGSGKIGQHCRPELLTEARWEDIPEESFEATLSGLVKPFTDYRKPLFRMRLLKCGTARYLFMDMHHMVSDGYSVGVLVEDCLRAYRGEKLEEDCYYSFLLSESRAPKTKAYAAAKRYFQALLGDTQWCTIPTLDYQSWEADIGVEELDLRLPAADMDAAARRWGASPNSLCVAAGLLALREYCQRDDVLVNWLDSNRAQTRSANIVGLLFKTLPVAVHMAQYDALDALIAEIRRQTDADFANSVCDFMEITQNALEDALEINYLPVLGGDQPPQGLREAALPDRYSATGNRACLYIDAAEGRLNVTSEYQKKAYAPGSMRRFLEIYRAQLRLIVQGDEL